MSLIGPQTTPLEPAYAQPRIVITPGTDLMLDLTPQSGLPSSKVLRCLARRLASLSGYASNTSLIKALLRALGSIGSSFVLRLMLLPLDCQIPLSNRGEGVGDVNLSFRRPLLRQPILLRSCRRGSRPPAS